VKTGVRKKVKDKEINGIRLGDYREDAEMVHEALTKRFEQYGVKLHPEKTRLMEFGRIALAKSEKEGGGTSRSSSGPCANGSREASKRLMLGVGSTCMIRWRSRRRSSIASSVFSGGP